MIEWYNELSVVQRIFALIALPSTAILVIQTILLFFGLGDNDADGDGVPDSDGFTLFSIRGIMAMLCVGGWSGILLSEAGIPTALVIFLATAIGFAALVGMALLISLLLKLQSSGNIQLSNAVGKVGQVYIPIPPNSTGSGKVNIILQDKYTEIAAMTTEDTAIKTGELIRVVSTDEIGMVIVERVKKTENTK